MSIKISGLFTPFPSGTYAITDAQYGLDGMRSVADATARNAITTARRRVGMLVALQSDLSLWQLNTSSNTGTDADWTQFTGGGGVTPIAAVPHEWLISLSPSGVFTQSQPAFTDISGTATTAQLPTTGLTITQHAATVGIATVSAGATTLDATTHDKYLVTLVNGTPTAITISGMVAGQTLSVSLLQDGTGSCTATYALSSGTLKWAGGSAPTLTTGASKGDKVVFDCVSSGVVWGMVAGQNF